jgi:hypothetical protein
LALTLVELLAGRTIIDGDHAAMMGTTLDPRRRPTPRNEGIAVSDGAEAVFLRALAVDPRERYQDAGHFWDALVAEVGVRGDAPDPFSQPARDRRAEVGYVPKVEHVDVGRVRSDPAPALSRDAPTQAARIASELELPGLPEPSAPEPLAATETAAVVPDLGVIPDLAPADPPPRPRTVSSRAAASVDLDLEDDAPPLDLALDLTPGERPSLRVGDSAPRWEKPSTGSSGTFLAERRAASTSGARHPAMAVGAEEHRDRAASGTSHRAARVASGAQHPAVALREEPPAGSEKPVASEQAVAEALDGVAKEVSVPRWSMPEIQAPTEPSLTRRLLPGICLVLASIVISIVDQIASAVSGEVFSLGPLRAGWIAAPLLLAGIVQIVLVLVKNLGR